MIREIGGNLAERPVYASELVESTGCFVELRVALILHRHVEGEAAMLRVGHQKCCGAGLSDVGAQWGDQRGRRARRGSKAGRREGVERLGRAVVLQVGHKQHRE